MTRSLALALCLGSQLIAFTAQAQVPRPPTAPGSAPDPVPTQGNPAGTRSGTAPPVPVSPPVPVPATPVRAPRTPTAPVGPTSKRPAAPIGTAPTASIPADAPAPAAPADTFEAEIAALVAQGGLTADQAAKQAVGNSPSVSRRVAELDVAAAQLASAKLANVPRVSAEASYTRLSHIPGVTLNFGGQAFAISFFDNSYLGRASISVPLSDYVLRTPKIIAAAKLGITAATLGKQASEIDAAYQARLAYYEWIRSRLQVMVSRRQLVQVQSTLGQVRALADAQRVSKADLLRVESQEAQADQIADQLDQLSQLREEQLRLIIGAPEGQALQIGEDIRGDVAVPDATALTELMAKAHTRVEFRSVDNGIAAKAAQQKAERANLYPRLSAFASTDYANPNQRQFPQEDKFKLTWSAGIQLQYTLNDVLLSRRADDRLQAEINELRADREQLDRGTRIQVLSAQQAVLVAQHALLSSAKGLEAAEEAYRVRQALLAAQRATAVELVDAETELTRARIAALDARIDLRVALVQLAYASGARPTGQ